MIFVYVAGLCSVSLRCTIPTLWVEFRFRQGVLEIDIMAAIAVVMGELHKS